MTRRIMAANNHPEVPAGYHDVEHDYLSFSCDTHPRCTPLREEGTVHCYCGEYSWKRGQVRTESGVPGNHSVVSCNGIVSVQLSNEKDTTTVKSYDPPPTHYDGTGAFDVWDIWDAFDMDRYTANAVKYLCRAGKKDIAPRLDDLKKAANYIAKAIEIEEKNGSS